MTHFGSIDRKEKFVPTLKTFDEVSTLKIFQVAACETYMESSGFTKEDVKLNMLDWAWLEWKDFNVSSIYQSLIFLTHTHTHTYVYTHTHTHTLA